MSLDKQNFMNQSKGSQKYQKKKMKSHASRKMAKILHHKQSGEKFKPTTQIRAEKIKGS
jgi:RNA:NAD 2'-phosphotransferase (TPT1/KptA family)